jgi:hypothetical protein
MYDLHHRLWIAISVSTVAIGLISPALAKPQQPLSRAIVSQPTNKAPINISKSSTPLDAVLANVRPKPSVPKVKRVNSRQATARSKTVNNIGRQGNTDPSLRGISHLTDADRDSLNTNVSAVDRLIK